MSRSNKTFAQVRNDILADIEAVRMGRLPKDTAAVIFQGYKELTSTINAEVAVAKLAMNAKQTGADFIKSVRLGQLVVNGDDEAVPRQIVE